MLSLENAINSRFFFHTEQNYQYFSPTEIKSKEHDESDNGERDPLSPFWSFILPSVDRGGTGKFKLFETVGAVPYFLYSAMSHIISDSEEAKWFKHLSELDSINSEICPRF